MAEVLKFPEKSPRTTVFMVEVGPIETIAKARKDGIIEHDYRVVVKAYLDAESKPIEVEEIVPVEVVKAKGLMTSRAYAGTKAVQTITLGIIRGEQC